MGFVRLTGLEPARRETPDPKSDASTNSATGAFHHAFFGYYALSGCKITNIFSFCQNFSGKFYNSVNSLTEICIGDVDFVVWGDSKLRLLAVAIVRWTG